MIILLIPLAPLSFYPKYVSSKGKVVVVGVPKYNQKLAVNTLKLN